MIDLHNLWTKSNFSFFVCKFFRILFFVLNRNEDDSDVEGATYSDDNELSTGRYLNVDYQKRELLNLSLL